MKIPKYIIDAIVAASNYRLMADDRERLVHEWVREKRPHVYDSPEYEIASGSWGSPSDEYSYEDILLCLSDKGTKEGSGGDSL